MIVLDLGHVGWTGGAPPARHDGLREDLLVIEYAGHAARLLLAGGEGVAVSGSSDYARRRREAVDRGATAYVACHVNSAPVGHPQDYAVCLYGRSGEALASSIAREMGRLPGVRRSLCRPAGPPDWPAATATLTDVGSVPSVLVEPGFIGAAGHRHLWTVDGLRRIGECIAAGVLRWRSGG